MNIVVLTAAGSGTRMHQDIPKQFIHVDNKPIIVYTMEAFENHPSIDAIVEEFKDKGITKIVGTESRGFIFGAPVALALGVPFVLVRKPKKLPREVISQSYQLEYGEDTLEIHTDSVNANDNVLVIDDLLATGGTIDATAKLIRKLGGKVEHAAFVICLPELGGRERLEQEGIKSFTLVNFEGH